MLVAGVDSSTQSTKVVLCDADDGTVVGRGSAPHPPGTEVDPAAWWDALGAAGAGLLNRAAAIGVAGQQHGMVVLDEAGEVIRPALLWNDLRSAAAAAELIGELGGRDGWAKATGSVPTASFTVTKLRWLATAEPPISALSPVQRPWPTPLRSRQVSQSCGSSTAAARAALAGSCRASQRSLVTVNEAVGTLPTWLAHHCGPPSSATSSAAAGADRRSFQSSAGLITSPPESRTIMPCCCPATPTASARSSSPSPAWSRAVHHAAGSASVPGGCGALPRPITVPSSARHSTTLQDCVDESTPATRWPPAPGPWTVTRDPPSR